MLRLRDLRKSFGQTVAVDGLSLEIKRGEVFGLLGPNGAGKTTTISMAIGLLTPDSGSVELEGFGSPRELAARAQIGVAPQALALYDALSGEENLRFFGKLYGLSGSTLASRVNAALEAVGLAARGKDRLSAYSGGMARRLNLAVAILHNPAILLLDEPTAGVDPQSRSSILDLVRAMKDQGRTVVYTTHYMEEAQRLCDRVGIVDRGKLLALGTVDDLIKSHGGRTVVHLERAGVTEKIPTSDPVRTMGEVLARGDVDGVRIERPDLEAVFLSLTGRSLRD